jgi:hypothetical protein
LAVGTGVAAGLDAGAGVADCAIGDFFAVADFADLDIEILHSVDGGVVPPPPKPHLGDQAGGAGSRSALGARIADSTAPIAAECQSFLDNLIAQLADS